MPSTKSFKTLSSRYCRIRTKMPAKGHSMLWLNCTSVIFGTTIKLLMQFGKLVNMRTLRLWLQLASSFWFSTTITNLNLKSPAKKKMLRSFLLSTRAAKWPKPKRRTSKERSKHRKERNRGKTKLTLEQTSCQLTHCMILRHVPRDCSINLRSRTINTT